MEGTEDGRQKKFLLVILFGIASLGLILGEMTIRFLGKSDRDGNLRLTILDKSLNIKPFHLPINFTKEEIEKYHGRRSYLMYDSTLGWVQRPRSTSESGLYHANAAGVRRGSIDENTRLKKNGLRIVLLGDSYTHGDEVPFEQTWGYYLEKSLARMGIQADVINLGVPGYGMDQAFLRWKTFGVTFAPDFVIFGFQPENVKRNLNLFRKLYYKPSGMPFAKPRFVLSGNRLHAINSPTVPPDKIVDVLEKFDEWENRKYEFFYRPQDYEDRIWLKSKFLGALLGGIEYLGDVPRERELYSLEEEPGKLALAILDELRSDVEQRGGAILMAILIPKWDFPYGSRGRPYPYQDLLDAIERRYDTVKAYKQLFLHAKDGNIDELFAGLHYSAKGNELVAEAIGGAIAARKSTRQNSPSP
jgi:lysophospholipase L1-like esterase